MPSPSLLVVAPYFPPKRGGLENYALEVARGMAAAGWRVCVATTNHERIARDVLRVDGVTVHRLARWVRLSHTPVSPAWPAALRTILGSERPDVVNVHTPVPVLSDIAVWLAGRTPTVVTYHGDVVKAQPVLRAAWGLFGAAVLRPTLRRATRIVATSERYAGRSPYLRPHRDKIAIIPPGVDVARFSPGPPSPGLARRYAGREVVLFVGQLDRSHAHKGVDDLLLAAAALRERHPALLCLVAGDGDARDAYRAKAARMGLGGHVAFPGALEDAELPDHYRLAKAAVLPSVNDTEGFGMVLLEANASGIPAVGTCVGGIPEAVSDGQTGLLVPPREPAALAEAISRLLSDPALRDRLGATGRERAAREFSWDRQLRRHLDLFENLLPPVR